MSKPLILCATDLGEDGQRAADLAAAFAAALDGRLVVIHATGAAGAAELDGPASMAEGAGTLSRRVRERLDREAATLEEHRERCEARGVTCEAALVDGRPAAAIEREAADRGAGLVVLGRRAHARVVQWLRETLRVAC